MCLYVFIHIVCACSYIYMCMQLMVWSFLSGCSYESCYMLVLKFLTATLCRWRRASCIDSSTDILLNKLLFSMQAFWLHSKGGFVLVRVDYLSKTLFKFSTKSKFSLFDKKDYQRMQLMNTWTNALVLLTIIMKCLYAGKNDHLNNFEKTVFVMHSKQVSVSMHAKLSYFLVEHL